MSMSRITRYQQAKSGYLAFGRPIRAIAEREADEGESVRLKSLFPQRLPGQNPAGARNGLMAAFDPNRTLS